MKATESVGTIVENAVGFAVTIEVRVIRKSTAGEDEVLIRRGGVTMALERLPGGGACISGIPDFVRDRATQECLWALADEGCPLRLELVMRRAPDALAELAELVVICGSDAAAGVLAAHKAKGGNKGPGGFNSPADLGRLIRQSLTTVRRLLARPRAAVTAVSGWLVFLADRLAAEFLREHTGGPAQ